MGMCASEIYSKPRSTSYSGDIEGVKMYIDDILILSKYCFRNYIEQLRIIFGRLRATSLKVNANKCGFGLKEIPYLGYVITWDGIKPALKKVQRIIDIRRTTTTTE